MKLTPLRRRRCWIVLVQEQTVVFASIRKCDLDQDHPRSSEAGVLNRYRVTDVPCRLGKTDRGATLYYYRDTIADK